MADTELKVDTLGAYFIKTMIDTYGIKLIDSALEVYKETVQTLREGMGSHNNLAQQLFAQISFTDLLHGGAVQGYRTQELAAIHRMIMPEAEREVYFADFGVTAQQCLFADQRVKVADNALNIPYPLGFSGMKEVFYEAHDRRLFPKFVSDVAFEKVIGYSDILLKGQSLSGVGGGIKTFVEGISSIESLAPMGSSALRALRNLGTPTVPLPTSEGSNQ